MKPSLAAPVAFDGLEKMRVDIARGGSWCGGSHHNAVASFVSTVVDVHGVARGAC